MAALNRTPFTFVAIFVALITATATTSVGGSTPAEAAAECWPTPTSAVVLDPFREPSCPYCSGNRGIEFAVPAGPVVAVASGRVTYAGTIAGVGYVVVDIGSGLRITYGRLAATSVRRGNVVFAGSRVGESSGLLYLGLRDHGRYIDPAPFLGELLGRPRLVPLSGQPRPSPSRLVCGQ